MEVGRRIWSAMLGVVLCAPLWSAHAQGTPPREVVRGTIASVEGQRLSLRTNDGATVTMQLSDTTRIAGVTKAALGDIAQGAFVGTAALPGANGELVAQEVHIFPESLRGTGEGHRPYNRGPQSTMTNATVAAVAPGAGGTARQSTMTNATVSASGTAGAGQRLTLDYKDGDKPGQKVVVVPPDVPVVKLEPGQRSLLVPGAHVTASATRQPDGSLAAVSVNVGKDGVVPPM